MQMTDNDNNVNPKDPSNLRRMILESPNQFVVGFEQAKDAKLSGSFKQVMISGMGGSALPGNLLRIYLNDLYKREKQPKIGIYQNRFYTLPPESYHECLNIICSYSGNTEETISAFNEAIKNGLPCIGVSAGGELEEICLKNNIPHVKLPIPFPNFQPRIGTGYFFAAIYQILVNHKLAPDNSFEILELTKKLREEMGDLEERGRLLAKKIVGKTPVVYTTTSFKALAMVWKIKFNENAKTPAFWNYFPELNHNEMIGFTNPQGKFIIIMLRDPKDHSLNSKRFDVTAGLLKKKNVEVEMINLQGREIFFEIFWSIILGDFTSYYLALEYNQDPTPVDMVEELKGLLAKD